MSTPTPLMGGTCLFLLMERADLPILQVLWLDRVQKKLKIDDAQASELSRAGLIEGHKPNFFVSSQIAELTRTQAQYTLNKGLDDLHFKRLILQHVEEFKSVPASDLRRLLLDKLPDSLTQAQKLSKVKNLLTALRINGLDGVRIEVNALGKKGRWRIRASAD